MTYLQDPLADRSRPVPGRGAEGVAVLAVRQLSLETKVVPLQAGTAAHLNTTDTGTDTSTRKTN